MSETPPDIKIQLNGKLDHSSADILFAANNNISFLTPNVLRVVSKTRFGTHLKGVIQGLGRITKNVIQGLGRITKRQLFKAWDASKRRYSRLGTHLKDVIKGLGRI